MIKIKKLPKPQILIEHAAEWTQQYCSQIDLGEKPNDNLASKYNNPIIKDTLEKETYGKCAYCESKIKHVAYGDIEHIFPKTKRPDLYVEWDNLTLACEQCNRSGKRTYYDPKLPLINPYIDQPEVHLQDIGPLIMPVMYDERADITEKVLKLNRPALIERRTERIKSVELLLRAWSKETNQAVKDMLKEQLCDEVSNDKEFSSTVKGFLISRGFPIDVAS